MTLPIPILETVDQLKEALMDRSYHVVEIPGRKHPVVMKRDSNQAPFRALVREALLELAVEQGLLVESEECCSAYELAAIEQ